MSAHRGARALKETLHRWIQRFDRVSGHATRQLSITIQREPCAAIASKVTHALTLTGWPQNSLSNGDCIVTYFWNGASGGGGGNGGTISLSVSTRAATGFESFDNEGSVVMYGIEYSAPSAVRPFLPPNGVVTFA